MEKIFGRLLDRDDGEGAGTYGNPELERRPLPLVLSTIHSRVALNLTRLKTRAKNMALSFKMNSRIKTFPLLLILPSTKSLANA